MKDHLAHEVKRLVPGAEKPPDEDSVVLTRQIGRPPGGTVFVASRCEWGKPRVLLTLPLLSDGKPFPAIFWLTCPFLARATGGLESGGFMTKMEEKMEEDPRWRGFFTDDEAGFTRLLDELAGLVGGDELRQRIGDKGIAGGKPGSVKCLHAHLAYYLVSGRGPVGRECWQLIKESVGESCEKIEEACSD